MVAKLIVWDVDREQATRRMVRALGEFELEGVRSLIPFHTGLLQTEQWANGETCRDLIEDKAWLKQFAQPKPEQPAADEDEPQEERSYAVEVSGRRFDVKVIGAAGAAATAARRPRGASRPSAASARMEPPRQPMERWSRRCRAPCCAWPSRRAPTWRRARSICVIEAMKMENEITAPAAGKVEELNVSEGGAVTSGDTIAVIK